MQPGEMVIITPNGGLITQQCVEGTLNPCIFEYIYLSRPDSVLNNISVYNFQLGLGTRLAQKIKWVTRVTGVNIVRLEQIGISIFGWGGQASPSLQHTAERLPMKRTLQAFHGCCRVGRCTLSCWRMQLPMHASMVSPNAIHLVWLQTSSTSPPCCLCCCAYACQSNVTPNPVPLTHTCTQSPTHNLSPLQGAQLGH